MVRVKKEDEEFYAIISNNVEPAEGNEQKEIIDDHVVSNITTTTAVKVDLAVHDVNNQIKSSEPEKSAENHNDRSEVETPETATNGTLKEQERVIINNGSGEGVLVIEEDNDEII